MAQRERTPHGADYPRKRTAIACEICRARRSKCDARKPACSKCVELEVECVYRKPNLWDREPVTAAATAALGKVDDRLDQIQDSIAALIEQVGSISRSSGGPLEYSSPLAFSPPNLSNFENIRGTFQGRAGPPSYGSLSSARPLGHRLPNLISFVAPSSLGPFSYDSSEQFFTGEVEQGNALFECIENFIASDVQADFSPQICWRLQRAFVSGFLRWMPIFGDETCLQHIQIASTSQFSGASPSSCMTLFMFAIGAMAADEHLYTEDLYQLPGFPYLALGYKILKDMRLPTGNICVYLSFAMRPVQSWHEINHVTRDCMLMLKTNWKSRDRADTDLKNRAFWVAYVIENELEVCLELPSSGIRTFQETLPLPTSPIEEEGMYFFLALISLRKLLAEVIETIGFKCRIPLLFLNEKLITKTAGHAIYVPIVAVELRNQILSWHDHLPVALQFPLDASPLFDLRRAHLRNQLFCLLSVIYWPFVLKHVEDSATQMEGTAENTVERAAVHERAKECLEWCILHLRASEGIMMQKTLVSHAALRAFYAILMVLLISYQPVQHQPPSPEIVIVIKRSLELLSMWDKVPFMREPIHRVCCFAAEAGILPPLKTP
ncbi:hypothetical protein G7Y89_g10732 [Cudoniella acicularis]|uniref:Zn(2)-C6 fungal-type domain-containing protein n=1 Tax=Cudoniella acicularis TaxID=354080 RepID=A0A8H4RF02_9HELO|nr:hypothetical protein G7Y89_g10732 [Cudoniella acicularis]